MRVNVERMPGSTVEVDIFADEDEFASAVDKAYQKIARDVTIPGFRRGKAPRHIIDGMVGRDAVVQEAGSDMMDDLFRRAIAQEQLVPVGEPRVGILQQNPIGFKVTIEVFPSVTLGDYASVRVEPREVELDENDVQQVLERLQKQHSEWIDVDPPRSPRDGDQVVLDLRVFEGDESFQEPAEDATFILGETPLFDSIVEALKMMAPDTSAELTLAFDEDDETVNPELRGKTLRYDITLKGVRERLQPELNDDLARKVGEGQYESFDAMRAQIEKDLLRGKAMEARGEVATEVINAMAETCEIDVPMSMVTKEVDDELTQFRSRLAQQGLSLDEYLQINGQSEDDLRDEIRPNAQRRVRNSVALQEIAKAEHIEVIDEDLNAEIDRLSAPSENPERLRTLYSSDYFRGLLENELFDRKLTEHLIDIATEGRGAVSGAGAEALKAEFETIAPNDSAEPAGDEERPEVAGEQDASRMEAQEQTREPLTSAADERDNSQGEADEQPAHELAAVENETPDRSAMAAETIDGPNDDAPARTPDMDAEQTRAQPG